MFTAAWLSACSTLPSGGVFEQPASDKVAVVALVDSARTDIAAGRLEPAGASLERALRIEPRNPTLWHELARLRLQQGRFAQAAALAAKSNGLPGGGNALKAANWRIIGEVRAHQGDEAGARSAFARAEALE